LQHPDTLALVREEAETVLGDGAATLARLKRLTVLERCLKEAERLHPPLVMLMRTVLRDLEVGDKIVPRGGLALVSPAISHRSPDAFRCPDQFDPNRFAPGHRCIGLAFAQQQVKVIWSLLLRRFEFELVGPAPRPDYATFVVGPKLPCRLRYRRRVRPALVAAAHLERVR